MAWSKIDAWVGTGDQWVGKGAHASKPSCYGLMVYQSANVYFMLGDGGARHDLITPNLPNTPSYIVFNIVFGYYIENFCYYPEFT